MRPGHGTLDQYFTLTRVLKGSWEIVHIVYMAFMDLEKAFERFPQGVLWGCSA